MLFVQLHFPPSYRVLPQCVDRVPQFSNPNAHVLLTCSHWHIELILRRIMGELPVFLGIATAIKFRKFYGKKTLRPAVAT